VEQWTDDLQLVFKLNSLMLRYPDKEWAENVDEIQELIHSLELVDMKNALLGFLEYVAKTSWVDLNENYVRWFDLTENKTMYLTYGLFGDNRERGPAFVQLKMEYAKAGFYLQDSELPDYLPLVLEFAAIAEMKYVKKVFAIHRKAIDTLYEELRKEQNPYHHLLEVCILAMEYLLPLKEQRLEPNVG
jgi:nitrate reductase molybdenum cofactor assembly chaperone NarJ/NarW